MVVRKLCLSLGFILSQRLPHRLSGSAARGIPSSSFNPGQRIEVFTIESNISTGTFPNATGNLLTYQIKGQEKTVARGEIHRVGLQKGSRTRSAGCFGRPFWAGPG